MRLLAYRSKPRCRSAGPNVTAQKTCLFERPNQNAVDGNRSSENFMRRSLSRANSFAVSPRKPIGMKQSLTVRFRQSYSVPTSLEKQKASTLAPALLKFNSIEDNKSRLCIWASDILGLQGIRSLWAIDQRTAQVLPLNATKPIFVSCLCQFVIKSISCLWWRE